jgi:hypothetical protein
MRGLAIAALLLLTSSGVANAACSEMVRLPWASAKKFNFTLEAHALGPNCAASAIVLLVVDAKGVVQWSTTRLAQQNAMFAEGVSNGASMKAALKNWLEQGLESKPQEANDLPVWKAGAEQAEREGDGEFGFYASESTSQEFYMDIRKENQPLFCFVQGIESTSCIAAAGTASISEIGGFTFPG